MAIEVMKDFDAVLVRGYDARMDPVLLRARVIRSTGIAYTVGELELIFYQTRRGQARCPLCPPVVGYAVGDTASEQPQPCSLLNLSTGGACIVSEQRYEAGKQLRLQIGPDKTGMGVFYPCKVVRAVPHRGSLFEYGLLFASLDRAQRGHLEQVLQEIQRETGKRLLLAKTY